MGNQQGTSISGEKSLNQVPVDIAARDILSLIKSKQAYTIRHCCLTGNNIFCISFFSFYSYLLEAIRVILLRKSS